MIGQHRRHSMAEALVNVVVGAAVSLAAQIGIFPLFGIVVPLRTNLWLMGAFTVVSVVRSYALRRAFNLLHVRRSKRLIALAANR